MGTLVNPVGWRLNANTFWKVNFLVPNTINSLAVNNSRVHYLVISNVLRNLNERLFNYGYMKFIRPIIYSFAGRIIVIITFRFFSDMLFRAKFRRAYKYRKPEMRKLKRKKRTRVNWLYYAIRKRTIYSRRRKRYEARLERLKKYEDLDLSRGQHRRLRLLIYRKEDSLWKLKKQQSKLLTRLHAKSQAKLKKLRWSRRFRLLFRMRKQNRYKLVRRLGRFFLPKKQKLRLYKWYGDRSVRLRFATYMRGRYFAKFKRFRLYIPGYGSNFYLRHKKVAGRYFRKVRPPKIKRKKIRRKGLTRFRYTKAPKRKRKKNLKKKKPKTGLRAKITKKKRFKQKRFFYGKRFSRKKYWRRRKRITGWRTLPRLRWKRRKRYFHRSLFFTWKLIPLLMYMKGFVRELLVRLENKRLVEVYFLNATKSVFLEASSILDFIMNFLKRRRRVTKINKLFYRIIRILRFFRARYRLRGFKLLLAGRFLRRDRATYIWRTRGGVPLGSKLSKIDYAVRTIQMKYSKPIVKLWICRR